MKVTVETECSIGTSQEECASAQDAARLFMGAMVAAGFAADSVLEGMVVAAYELGYKEAMDE